MLDTIARKIMPIKMRQAIGCYCLNHSAKNKKLLSLYMLLVHGYSTDNLELLPNNEACYTYNGLKVVMPNDGIGSAYEIYKERVYDNTIKVGDCGIVIDVGAYVGMFAIKVAKQAKMVIAIEPEPNNYARLKANMDRNSIGNIMALNQAVSDRNGTAVLNVSGASACHSLVYNVGTDKLKIKVNTIDRLLSRLKMHNETIDFIKIDAEGSEMQVLLGAHDTLSRTRKVSVAAYHTMPNGDKEISNIIWYLKNAGFSIVKHKGLRSYVYAEKSI